MQTPYPQKTQNNDCNILVALSWTAPEGRRKEEDPKQHREQQSRRR